MVGQADEQISRQMDSMKQKFVSTFEKGEQNEIVKYPFYQEMTFYFHSQHHQLHS